MRLVAADDPDDKAREETVEDFLQGAILLVEPDHLGAFAIKECSYNLMFDGIAIQPAVREAFAVEVIGSVLKQDFAQLSARSIHELQGPRLPFLARPQHDQLSGFVARPDDIDVLQINRAFFPMVPDQAMQCHQAVAGCHRELEPPFYVSQITERVSRVRPGKGL